MNDQDNITTFDSLCQTYSTWVIKYCSTSFNCPLYIIWYTDTDENRTDRLLTFKDGYILAVDSLADLKDTILAEVDKLTDFENLQPWLNSFENLEVVADCTYNIAAIQQAIGKGNLDTTSLENFTNFINLYGDFVYQDKKNSHLQVYADNELIKSAWDFYYEFIFWPRFNDKEKYEQWDKPSLIIETKELLLKLNDIIKTFEGNIRIAGKAIF